MAEHQPADWTLWCIVIDAESPFPVDIRSNTTVGALKEAIKIKNQPEFDGFAANRLTLYLVNLPDDDDLAKIVKQPPTIKLPTALKATKQIGDLFPDGPTKDTAHILVQTPDTHGSKRKRSSSDVDDPSQPPPKLRLQMDTPSKAGTPKVIRSMTEKFLVQCNRPTSDTTIPLRLIHPIFGEFADDCNSFDPGPEEQDFVNSLFNMTTIFESEMDRQTFFNGAFAEYFGMRLSLEAIPGTNRTTDGHLYVIGSSTSPFIVFIVEGRNEFVNNQTDPRYQVILYYREYVRSLYQKHKALAASTPLPAILMTYFGPNLEVSGVITHPDATIQSMPLTPWFRLDEDWHDSNNWTMLAKCVGALKRSLNALSNYYDSLPKSPVPSSVPSSTAALFPYPREYKDIESGAKITFNYIERLYEDVLLFRAIDDQTRPLFIKFVKQYSTEIHQFLSSTSRAPILYGLTTLPGGWIMVIMEELKEPWIELLKIQPEERQPFRQPIEETVNLLHASGYVHGDIRASNILVCPSDLSQGIKFIDFDEAGKAGEALYPHNLNVKDIKRPDGAVGRRKILKEHDLWMMKELFVQKPASNYRSIRWPYGVRNQKSGFPCPD